MNMPSIIPYLFLVALAVILLWLIVNGLQQRSVWVRGARNARSSDPRQWATPVARDTNPAGYWLAIGFYTVGLGVIFWALFI